MSHNKAIVISPFWATILSALIITGIGGGFATAKGIYDAQAEAGTERAIINQKLNPLSDAKLPERMARIEETVKNTDKNVDEMNRKIDFLVRQQVRR